MKQLLSALVIIALYGCSNDLKQEYTKEEIVQQIRDVEKAFEAKIAAEGLAAGFIYYAAEDATIRRSELLKGKAAIIEYYSSSTNLSETVIWTPNFIEVSDDHSMAFATGPYTFSGLRANGESFEASGNTETVWKRQKDGSWKYVFD